MKRTETAGGVVLNQRGEVLVVSQHGLSWSLPKGHIDLGETPEETARREIFEETGVSDLLLVRPLGRYERYRIAKDGGDDTSEVKTMHFFLFTTKEEKLSPRDPDNPEARWIAREKVSSILTHKKDKEFFENVLKDELIKI